MARIVEAPPATGETVDISFTQPSPAPSARTSKRTLQPIAAPRLIAGEWKEDAEHARDLCRHPPPIGTVHTSGCAAATPGAIPSHCSLPSPMRQRMQPECEDARKAGTWQLMAAYICKGRNPSGVRGASASLFAGRFDAMINGID
jgi:hypothetical protein